MQTLTGRERMIRQNIRNFLMVATPDELRRELRISEERGDALRARFVRELIDESENNHES